jgi:hypothetical protein
MRLTYRTRRYGTSFRSAGAAVGAARERQLCGPRSRGPKVGPVMPPSVRLRCGVPAALRAGPVLPLTAACGGLGLVDAAPGGAGTAKDTGRPHVVADDGRGGTSSGGEGGCADDFHEKVRGAAKGGGVPRLSRARVCRRARVGCAAWHRYRGRRRWPGRRWGGDCAARRGGAAGCFPAGTGMVLLEGSVGIVHAPARGVPVRCLLAGWKLGRGNDGGLGMVGAMTGAVPMVGG